MKPPPCLSAVEIAVLSARYRGALDGDASTAAQQLLAHSSPPNWALEWSLPRWLGDALRLTPAVSQELVLANIFGLTYIRLQDGLTDGDLLGSERQQALALAVRLFGLWNAVYRRLFDGDSVFWAHFERFLGQWRRALLASARLPEKAFAAYDEADFMLLGYRGAPLKICAAAAYILADRETRLPEAEAALDQLMIGAVLLDHAADWQEDLMAGRPNAFVAYASACPQIAAQQAANRNAVFSMLTIGDGGRPYFARITERLRSAGMSAQALGLSALVEYETWLRGQAARFGRRLAREARLQLRTAVGALLAASAA